VPAGKLGYSAIVAKDSRAGAGSRVAGGDERSELALERRWPARDISVTVSPRLLGGIGALAILHV
jgi:hypothetical protein